MYLKLLVSFDYLLLFASRMKFNRRKNDIKYTNKKNKIIIIYFLFRAKFQLQISEDNLPAIYGECICKTLQMQLLETAKRSSKHSIYSHRKLYANNDSNCCYYCVHTLAYWYFICTFFYSFSFVDFVSFYYASMKLIPEFITTESSIETSYFGKKEKKRKQSKEEERKKKNKATRSKRKVETIVNEREKNNQTKREGKRKEFKNLI